RPWWRIERGLWPPRGALVLRWSTECLELACSSFCRSAAGMGVLGCLLFLAMALKLQHVPLGDPVSRVEEVLRAGDVQARVLGVVAAVPADRLRELGREQLAWDLRDEVRG